MSLEAALQANTEAVNRLAALLQAQSANDNPSQRELPLPMPDANPEDSGKPAKPEKAAEAPEPEEPAKSVKAKVTTETTTESKAQQAPSYQETADLFLRFVKMQGREAAIGLLKEYDAGKLPDLVDESVTASDDAKGAPCPGLAAFYADLQARTEEAVTA